MKIPREDTARTCGRLLAAAGELFARKGYRNAKIAEICEKAGVNVAAVNYHFGSKQVLYREAWLSAFKESLRKHPPDGGVPPGASPEERLHGQIQALLHRIADENNWEFWIMQRELTNPTGLLEEVMSEEVRPLQKRKEALVRELLGGDVAERDVHFCEVSIISQCINPLVFHQGYPEEKEGFPPKIEDMDAFARHVLTFSLAGIRAIREAGGKIGADNDGME